MARIGQPVLDLFLAQLALQLNKTVGSVETNDEQCEAFNSLGDDLTLNILNNTLTEHENLRPVITEVSADNRDCLGITAPLPQ